MRDPVRLTPADARRVAWRNGRGVTEEILIRPEGASFERGDFDLRISKAGVTEAGPFSSFPGFDRVLVVTGGAGLDLSHGDAAPPAHVAPLEPYAFSGDWPTTADLVGGPVADFNVIVRRGRCKVDVSVLRPTLLGGVPSGVDAATADLFLHVVSGRLRAGAMGERGTTEELGTLSAGESLWMRDVRPRADHLSLAATPADRPLSPGRPDADAAVAIVVWGSRGRW